MEVPGSGQEGPRHDRERDVAGETVEFGGLPFRSPFGDVRALRVLRARLGPHMTRGVASRTVAISLALGLLIGFAVGHFTASSSAGKKPASANGPVASVEPEFATTTISFTGNRCAVRLGNKLLLGIQLINESDSPVTLGRISTMFPLGGLRAISAGEGACGSLPTVLRPSPLPPRSTDWIFATVAVRVSCPQPLPVWFKINYSVAGKTSTVVITGFPDLGSVPYGQCATLGDTLPAGGSAPPGTPRNPSPRTSSIRNP